ncbi:MAG: hypothetical protein A2Y07_05660 [Planctomycetes bacterium GWF2_50_10]|nr:MAG: hypothetical protein A2Y07_05660 [Planctomycetes bacterium GWF2_50_10]
MDEHSITKQLIDLVAQIDPANSNLTALPCANQYPDLQGFSPATGDFTPGHYTLAILVSIANTLKQLVQTLYPDQTPSKIIATGGGAKSPFWLALKARLVNTES